MYNVRRRNSFMKIKTEASKIASIVHRILEVLLTYLSYHLEPSPRGEDNSIEKSTPFIFYFRHLISFHLDFQERIQSFEGMDSTDTELGCEH